MHRERCCRRVDAKSATIKLADDVEGMLKASDISRDKVEDARNVLKVGDSVEAKIIAVDRKNRGLACQSKPRTLKTRRKQ